MIKESDEQDKATEAYQGSPSATPLALAGRRYVLAADDHRAMLSTQQLANLTNLHQTQPQPDN